jgi:hypothetical protein
MDFLTQREMRIAGLSIAPTVVALNLAELGSHEAFNIIRVALAVLGLCLVLFARPLSHRQ